MILFWYSMAAVQLVYWGLIFQRIAWYKIPSVAASLPLPAVSIVICARNEAANLQKNLESILLQDYSPFEVVVVNDDSSDKTAVVLEQFQQQFSNLKIISLSNKVGLGKKAALAQGIQQAQYDWILLTDADCHPSSSYWIRTMSCSAQATKSSILLGYGPYSDDNTWLSKWVQFETVYVAIQYFSFALWKQPYMGVGRNLMYKKSLFFDNNGFEKHETIASGDDDLFVNEVANGGNTSICLDKDSFMYSSAPTSWKQLYQQKTRHYSSSTHYKWKHKLALGALALSHFIFYVGLFAFIVGNVWNYVILVILMLRTFLYGLVFYNYLKSIQNTKLFLYIWVLDVLVPVYYVVFASALTGEHPKKWK